MPVYAYSHLKEYHINITIHNVRRYETLKKVMEVHKLCYAETVTSMNLLVMNLFMGLITSSY